MEAQRFRIVLTGEIMDGHDAEQATRSLATLFGQPPEKLRNIFSGKSVPLKQVMELGRAQQIQARLHAVGAKCILQPVEVPPPAGLSLLDDAPPPKKETAIKLQVNCPKCGTPQEPADFCSNCGLVFSKWKEEEAGLNEEQLLHLFVDANGEKYLSKFQHFRASQGYALTWHWPALFVPFFWALYRKMWGWSAVIFVSMFAILGLWAWSPTTTYASVFNLVSLFVWPLTANYIYFRHAKSRLARLGKNPVESTVAEAGGTSAKAVWLALGACFALGVIGSSLLMKQGLELEKGYAVAATNAKEQAPDTQQGRKTLMVLRATAFMTNLWLATGKELADVSIENLAADLQQPVESFHDGWDNPVRVSPTAESFTISSAGPDGLFDSADDIRFEAPVNR